MVKEWLSMTKDEHGNEFPKLRIFETCPNLIRTLQLLVYDPKDPNDALATNHEHSHAPDALRYWCISWNYPPSRESNIYKPTEFEKFFGIKHETKGGYAEWEND